MLILIADDEAGVRQTLQEFFRGKHEVYLCEDGRSALQVLEKKAFDLVLTDQNMPGLNGLDLIRQGLQISPATSFILMTAYGSVEQAVDAIRLGAEDYFQKPFDLAEVDHRIRRIEELKTWRNETALHQLERHGIHRLLGKSQTIVRAKEFVQKVAGISSPVLILGASGTGKEVLARAIHEEGKKPSSPFVAINCASLNEQLMESELFGHEKGAFTGATTPKPGKFELALGGTLFLDEVGELSPSLQSKLLRVLQEKEFYRVGGTRLIKADARVIAATNRPLSQMILEKTFREDLYYRLNVLNFEMTPLHHRSEDIPLLIDYFWKKLTSDLGRKCILSKEAHQILQNYSFPGNVRELVNILERLIVLGPEEGMISENSLPLECRKLQGPIQIQRSHISALGQKTLTEITEELESALIQEAMARSQHNQIKAAELLGITRGALQYKLKKYFPQLKAA